jgi:hypothetical protein
MPLSEFSAPLPRMAANNVAAGGHNRVTIQHGSLPGVVIRHGKRARRPHLQQPGAGALAGPMPTWTSFMLEIASSELGIRGTAGLPNLAASPSELNIRR